MLFGPIDPSCGDENKAPQKVIHDPSPYEMEQVNGALNKCCIFGAKKGILMMGEKVFEQPWVSMETRNWLGLLKSDVGVWEESTDPTDRDLRLVMIELDYMMVMVGLERDAAVARQADESQRKR